MTVGRVHILERSYFEMAMRNDWNRLARAVNDLPVYLKGVSNISYCARKRARVSHYDLSLRDLDCG